MKAKKIIALLLAATLSMTAFTGCAINKDATVATLDDENIKLGLVNFIIRYQEAGFDDMYIQYMGEGYWDNTVTGSDTVLDTWKSNVVETVHEFYTLKAHMSDYDVEITDDEESKIEDAAKQFMKDNSDDTIDEMGATEDIVKEYLELQLIRTKMYAAIIANDDSDVTDEEANMSSYTAVKLDYKGYYDSSYQYQSYTDDEAEQIKSTAETIAAAVAEGTSLEDAATAAGTSATTGTYATYVDPSQEETPDDSTDDTESADSTEDTEDTESSESTTSDSVYTTNTLDDSVVDALNSLEEGQVSDLITTDDSYYIVRLDKRTDEEATESNRETVKGNKEDKYYNDILSGWQDDESWSVKQSQLDKIKIHNYFTTSTESTEDTESTGTTDTTESTETTDNTENTEAVDGTEN